MNTLVARFCGSCGENVNRNPLERFPVLQNLFSLLTRKLHHFGIISLFIIVNFMLLKSFDHTLWGHPSHHNLVKARRMNLVSGTMQTDEFISRQQFTNALRKSLNALEIEINSHEIDPVHKALLKLSSKAITTEIKKKTDRQFAIQIVAEIIPFIEKKSCIVIKAPASVRYKDINRDPALRKAYKRVGAMNLFSFIQSDLFKPATPISGYETISILVNLMENVRYHRARARADQRKIIDSLFTELSRDNQQFSLLNELSRYRFFSRYRDNHNENSAISLLPQSDLAWFGYFLSSTSLVSKRVNFCQPEAVYLEKCANLWFQYFTASNIIDPSRNATALQFAQILTRVVDGVDSGLSTKVTSKQVKNFLVKNNLPLSLLQNRGINRIEAFCALAYVVKNLSNSKKNIGDSA